ncbi:MAG: nitroreductase family protein [Burkholderiaceae bacterium]
MSETTQTGAATRSRADHDEHRDRAAGLVEAVLGTGAAPTRLRRVYGLVRFGPRIVREYLRDCARFLRYSASLSVASRRNLRAKITEAFHNIEKGLSLPAPRPGFGAQAIDNLLSLCDAYAARYSADERVLYAARDVLREYQRFNEAAGHPDYPHRRRLDAFVNRLRGGGDQRYGGVRPMSRASVAAAIDGVRTEFFLQRHSVRQFSGEPVDLALIDEAVRIALKAPAVCNRQYSRIVVVADPDRIGEALRMQGGARGFADAVDKLIVVTTPASQFWAAEERNQPWIDGGLFAMSLLLGLHAQGLGTCCLNWSKDNARTARMRRFLDLDEDELIVMMIAVGHLPDTFQVAYSHRVPPSECMRVLDRAA